MIVRDIMSKNVVTISMDSSALLAAQLLSRNNIGSLPVCSEEGHLRGIVTDRDIITRCVAAECDPSTTPVREIMTRNIARITPDSDISEAARLMSASQIRRLPVVDDDKLVGYVALGDIAKRRLCTMEAARALSEISSNVRRV